MDGWLAGWLAVSLTGKLKGSVCVCVFNIYNQRLVTLTSKSISFHFVCILFASLHFKICNDKMTNTSQVLEDTLFFISFFPRRRQHRRQRQRRNDTVADDDNVIVFLMEFIRV